VPGDDLARMNDPVQLQAWIPEQLLLRFNEQAPHGQRNELVEAALERFLATRNSRVRPRLPTEIELIDEIVDERQAIELMRYHAAEILRIAAHVANLRKGPKAVPSRKKSVRKAG
jgi:hypothetical protein